MFFVAARPASRRAASMATPSRTAQVKASPIPTPGSCGSVGGSFPVTRFQPYPTSLRAPYAPAKAAKAPTALLTPSARLSAMPSSSLRPLAAGPLPTLTVDHPMVTPFVRAVGLAPLMAAASSAGRRVQTSQYGASAASVLIFVFGSFRLVSHPGRRRGGAAWAAGAACAGLATSTYTDR